MTSDNLRKLQVTQNALARVVCQATRFSATELRHQLHWLPVKQRIDINVDRFKYSVQLYVTSAIGLLHKSEVAIITERT